MSNSSSDNTQRAVIFYDGVCHLCNASVQFVLKRDKKKTFNFCSLQSKRAAEIFKNMPYLTQAPASVVLAQDGKVYVESTAALTIAKELNGLWPMLYMFILVPPVLRDAVYRWVANNRYRWFGKYDSCPIPKPEWKDRFLDVS